MQFKTSELATKMLGHLKGCEIGPASHNPFFLNTIMCGHSTEGTQYAKEEKELCGENVKLDVICDGDNLPFPDASQDFVISSHVLEHFYDPIKTVKEWLRVVRPGGFVFSIIPHKERTFDKDRPRTTLQELLDRHASPPEGRPTEDKHWSVWITEDFLELCKHMGWNVVATEDVDGKVGNGFTVVIQK